MSKAEREALAAMIAKLLEFIGAAEDDWYDAGDRVYNRAGTDVTPSPAQIALMRNGLVELVANIRKLAVSVAGYKGNE